MKVLKYFQFKHFVVLFLIFYGLLFFLDSAKAQGVFWGTIERINLTVEWGQQLFDLSPMPKEKEIPTPSLSPSPYPQKPPSPIGIPKNDRQLGA